MTGKFLVVLEIQSVISQTQLAYLQLAANSPPFIVSSSSSSSSFFFFFFFFFFFYSFFFLFSFSLGGVGGSCVTWKGRLRFVRLNIYIKERKKERKKEYALVHVIVTPLCS
jgi:hypothetical protein